METQEKIGEVLRTPFGALKKICEENSITRVIGNLLPRFEKIVDNGVKAKEQVPMFSKETRNACLGEDIMDEFKEQKEKEDFEI